MTIYIATLAADALSNWQICKQRSLWGTRSRRDGRDGSTHMHAVRPGDQAFVWFSKRGIGALMRATGRATEPPTQIWPDGATYALAFPMVVEKEIAKPITDRFTLPGRTGQTHGMKGAWLQQGLYPLPPDIAVKIMSEFDRRRSGSPLVRRTATTRGASRARPR